MFGGPFNRLPFSRSLTVEALFSVTFESQSEVSARLSVEFPLSASFATETAFDAALTREMEFAALFETIPEIVTELTRERFYGVTFESVTEINAIITYSRVNKIAFNGAFKPGDRIVIDTKRKTVTINGQNALHLVDGDFFDLIAGTNKITYTDSATSRNVLTRITHRDKYLY